MSTKRISLGLKTNCYAFGHAERVEDIGWRNIRIVPRDYSKKAIRIGDDETLVVTDLIITCYREIGDESNSKNIKLCRE